MSFIQHVLDYFRKPDSGQPRRTYRSAKYEAQVRENLRKAGVVIENAEGNPHGIPQVNLDSFFERQIGAQHKARDQFDSARRLVDRDAWLGREE